MKSPKCFFIALCGLGSFYIIYFYGVSFNHTFESSIDCEPIHIGIVCLKERFNTINLYVILKSIYFYRNNPIYLHILVDNQSEVILKTLFNTWSAHHIYTNIYSLPESFEGVFGDLAKLVFPLLVPKDVRYLLVIDSDLFCVGNVEVLWKLRHQNSNEILFLSNDEWAWTIWLFDLQVLNSSLAYKDVVRNIATYKKETSKFILEATNLKVDRKQIDHRFFRCSLISQIENKNEFTPIYNAITQVDTEFIPDWLSCPAMHVPQTKPKSYIKECNEIPEVDPENFKHRTLLFANYLPKSKKTQEITMVTQMSLDKFPVFEIAYQKWSGPVSVALYLKENDLSLALSLISKSARLKKQRSVVYHIVFKKGRYHPINKLRNIALKSANTPYVFLTDVDFVPGIDVYTDIKNQIKNMSTMHKKALVVPAFEVINPKIVLPEVLKNAHDLWHNKSITPFQIGHFFRGHGPTDYENLETAKEPYIVKWKPNYEPYVVVESSVAEYDEHFVGYSWNKLQHIHELDAAGYEFIVLPNTFVVHKYHEKSADYQIWRKDKFNPCMTALKKRFVQDLNAKYNRSYDFEDFSV